MLNRIILSALFPAFSLLLSAQTLGIDDVLRNVEVNNKLLQANGQETVSEKLETKAANNLPDPTVSYSYLWGKEENMSEIEVTQGFDFPTVYATRNRMNRMKISALDSRQAAFRQELLLQAREVCLDIIFLKQQKEILVERLNNARILSEVYQRKLQAGDATIIETNKINLEMLNVQSEVTLNETELRNKKMELTVLNGNREIDFDASDYPVSFLERDFEVLRAEVVASDRSLHALGLGTAASAVEVNLNKNQWLPKLELGYRRSVEGGIPFNGVVAGISIPLFENRHKVKKARAQRLNSELLLANKQMEVESELAQLFGQAQSLLATIKAYEQAFATQSDLTVLKEALTGGELSIVDYFVEVAVVYQSKLNYLGLKNRYEKVVGQIYKGSL